MRRNVVRTQALYVRVGARLRAARREQGVASAWLAPRVGLTQRTLQRMETGQVPFALHVVMAIANELDTSLDALLPVDLEEEKRVA